MPALVIPSALVSSVAVYLPPASVIGRWLYEAAPGFRQRRVTLASPSASVTPTEMVTDFRAVAQ